MGDERARYALEEQLSRPEPLVLRKQPPPPPKKRPKPDRTAANEYQRAWRAARTDAQKEAVRTTERLRARRYRSTPEGRARKNAIRRAWWASLTQAERLAYAQRRNARRAAKRPP